METQKIQQEKQSSPVAPTPAMTSCRKKKKDDATFLEDLKDHIDEFVNASMEEHKTCFSKTIKKVHFHSAHMCKASFHFVFIFHFLLDDICWIFRCLVCQKLQQKGMLTPRKLKAPCPFRQQFQIKLPSLLRAVDIWFQATLTCIYQRLAKIQ